MTLIIYKERMKKFIYLSTCDTCKRIMKELSLPADVLLQDIKKEPIDATQLSSLYAKTNSYEALINKRARKFKEWGLNAKTLTESEFKDLLLKDYTFLKRPVLIWDEHLFIGNAKATVEEAKEVVLKG